MGEVNKTNNYTEFYYHFFRNILLVGIPLVIISAIVLSSLRISATGSGSGTDSLTISISSACTLSSVVDTEHNASINAGTYKDNIGKTTIKTTCNDNNGYSIYANGYSNNEEGNNRLINTLSSSNVIETGLNTSGDVSSWAMKLNNIPDDPSPTPPVIESAYDDAYGLIPSNWTKILSLPSGSTDMSLGSSFTTTYAVYTNSRQYTGTYQGQVKYVLTHPSYQPYVYYMQEVDKWKKLLALEESVQAIDMRDGKQYWVAKLKDGNIWMTQNLDFDIDSTKTYTHNDTDLGWDTNSFDTNATWTPDTTNGKYNLPVNGTSVPNWSNQKNYPYSADPGDVYYYTSNSEADDIKYTSLSACTAAGHTEGECKRYHAGNYYNWTAAIASNNSSSLTAQYTNAPNSVCPAGWRLPIARNNEGQEYEFSDLLITQNIINSSVNPTYTTNGFNKIRLSPLWFTRMGYINSNSLSNSANMGYYWSSTVRNNDYVFNFSFSSGSIGLSNIVAYSENLRQIGRSIRCLAR